MNRTVCRTREKALTVCCVLWLACLLLPLLLMCFYAYPAYDDFTHITDAATAYCSGEGLFGALRAAARHTTDMYRTWQGTFGAMFLSSFQPVIAGSGLYFWTPLLTLALLVLSCGCFCDRLIRVRLKMDRTRCLVFFTVMITLLLTFAPGMRESIYWLSGTPYTDGIIVLFFLVSHMLSREQAGGGMVRRAGSLIVSVLLGIAAGSLPYPVALATAAACVCYAAWCLYQKNKARPNAIAAAVATAASLIVVVLAPGNAVRQAKVGEAASPVSAVVYALIEAARMAGEWLKPQWIGAVLILILLLWKPLKESSVRFSKPVWFALFSFGILAAAFVPPIYATGQKSYLVERVLSSLYMLFVPVMLLNIVYWMGWLAKRVDIRVSETGSTVLRRFVLLTAVVCLIWGMIATSIFTTAPVSAIRSLLDGSAVQYHNELTAREEAMTIAQSDEEVLGAVQALNASPDLLYPDRMPEFAKNSPMFVLRTADLMKLQRGNGSNQP